VLVQVFDDHDVFMVRSVGLPGNAGHLGICFGQLVTMDSPRARPPGSVNWQQVLWHEFVHVITLQKTNNRMPRWLSEGISVFEETHRGSAWGQKLSPNFKKVVDEEGYPDLADLEALFTTPPSPVHLMFGYFAAGEFAHWYVNTYGQPALVQALDDIGTGAKAEEALSKACGQPVKKMDTQFQAHMALRCAPLKQMRENSPFQQTLQTAKKAVASGDTLKAAAAFRKAFELYPDYDSPDAPLRQLSELYAQHDSAAHRETLQQLIMWDATAFDACVQLGLLFETQGNFQEAKHALDRAFVINPFQTTLIAQRARVQTALGHFESAVKDLHRLIQLNDQADYRLTLARVLFQQGNHKAAHGEVLALLEKWPHFWEAQSLLLEIVEKP
jgi:tetratricopeptide (TPR) repeat protein